jgi:hypothetical protein
MDVHFSPETEVKLRELASRSGRTPDDILQDAVAGYLDEVVGTRRMLDQRYEQLEKDTVELMDGEEARARLKAKTELERKRRA